MISSSDRDLFGIIATRLERSGLCKRIPTAIYARKSTEDVSKVSIQGQIDNCRAEIERNPQLELVKIYSDEDYSGMNIERPSFQDLVRDINSGKILIVISNTIERISRDVGNYETFRKFVESKGGSLVTVQESFERSPSGQFFKQIMLATAEMQPRVAASNSMRSLLFKARKCQFCGGMANFGYQIINNEYFIVEDEATAVRMAFEHYLTGMSYASIAKELNSLGFHTRKGKNFSASSIRSILANSKYMGTYVYNSLDKPKKKNRVLIECFDEISIDSGIPSIVSKDIFTAVQSKMASRLGSRSKEPIKTPFPLTGLLKCGCCGAPMHGTVSTQKQRNIRRELYICSTRDSRRHDKTCVTRAIRKDEIERAVSTVIVSILSELASSSSAMEFFSSVYTKNVRNELAVIKRKITAVSDEILHQKSALFKISDNELFASVESSIVNSNQVLKDLTRTKNSLDRKLSSTIATVKDRLRNGTAITVDELVSSPSSLKSLSNIFFKDITVSNKEIVVNLKDFTE